MNNPDAIFMCKKCRHFVYVNKKDIIKKMVIDLPDCPKCGEEGDEIWILIGEGNFKNETRT